LGGGNGEKVENFRDWVYSKYPNLTVHDACRLIDLYYVPFDRRMYDYCEQYEYCKEWGTSPYGSYADTPNEWKEIDKEIKMCKSKISKIKQVRNGNRI
jgi:hypothetical protein